jgi:ADP-ribosylglycohydrolase
MTPKDPYARSSREDLPAGAILGLAVGDALGATYEFCSPREVPQGPLEMVGGGWLGLEPGETTDDTALTKAVLTGYEGGSLDLRRVRDAMLSWQDTDPKDIGNQTHRALDYLRSHPDALFLPEDPDAQGNGAVMRAAAHGVKARSAEEAAENAWAEAALTHPSWVARASSALVTSVAVPPMFEASTSTMRNGIGSSSRIRAITSVTGNISSTVVTLSRKAESNAVIPAR